MLEHSQYSHNLFAFDFLNIPEIETFHQRGLVFSHLKEM
jgi:hypothetical protein